MYLNIGSRLPKGVVLAGLLFGQYFGSAQAEAKRWYQPDQVRLGGELFTKRCATCHGANAEATPDWRKKTATGQYPPPPLDGSAHAWHHPMAVLRHTIRRGGAPVGGVMPPFGDRLSSAEIDAVIAFFQDKWPAEIYTAWFERNHQSAPKTLSSAPPKQAANPIIAFIDRFLFSLNPGNPESNL